MVDIRTVQLGGVWANGAPDPPASPITEVTYADSNLSQATIEEGWPYSTIVNGSEFNEFMRRMSSLVQLQENWGVLPWCAEITYAAGAFVLGTDGNLYMSLVSNLNKNPVSTSGYWRFSSAWIVRGTTAPSNPFPNMLWWDTGTAGSSILKTYITGLGWVALFNVNTATGAIQLYASVQFPVGHIFPVIGSETPPTGTLECDWSAISRTTYSSLFSGSPLSIGTKFGPGNGSTTFNLPDMRGYAIRGWDHGAGVDPDAATRLDRGDGTVGDHVGTKQDDQNKAHTHTYGRLYTGSPLVSQGISLAYGTGATGSSGGDEARMKNINVMWCIAY